MASVSGLRRARASDGPLVSVIIPVFNAELFLERCLDSVIGQTMPDLEIIAVNDGSTDRSLEILREYEEREPRLRVFDQPNAGQGAARNRALDLARGEYVLVVDADDFIESVTLQVTTERAEEDGSDLVHFDWKLYAPSPDHSRQFHYYNADPFWHKRTLEGIECDELLRVENFYSVSNLYRLSFLNQHGIRFEEGRIYEDNPFVLQAVNRAQLVSLVHSPLYAINPHPESTTRSNVNGDRHYRDHIHAIRRSFELLNRRNPRALTYLAAYHIKKIGPYYQRRIPRKYRRAYIRDFVDVLHDAGFFEIPEATSANKPTRLSIRLGIFKHRRYRQFQAIVVGKNELMPRFKKARAKVRKLKHLRDPKSPWSSQLQEALEQPVLTGTISFLGLDYRYTGNSRYLFEEMIRDPRFEGKDIRFVTKDDRVAPRYRLDPDAIETFVHLARSEMVIAESWIPPKVRKHRDSTWVQLWHGTPIKRMLFDSHEPRIIWNRRHHKTNKYRDIQNWDYLLVDSPMAADKFETAFLFPRERMLQFRYPRVQFLLDHADDENLKSEIRTRIGIDPHSPGKVVLYAPTWRDYNYGKSQDEGDYAYLLDVEQLAEELGDGYTVLLHDHGYLASTLSAEGTRCINANTVEVQELLLVADLVVSDYSSIVFDALTVGKQVALYAVDQASFEEDRGFYPGIWATLEEFRGTKASKIAQAVGIDGGGATYCEPAPERARALCSQLLTLETPQGPSITHLLSPTKRMLQ